MTEREFHGPRPAAQFDSVPVPELARLRRIEGAAVAMVASWQAYFAETGGKPARMWESFRLLREVVTCRITP